jgi:hypothetical protein
MVRPTFASLTSPLCRCTLLLIQSVSLRSAIVDSDAGLSDLQRAYTLWRSKVCIVENHRLGFGLTSLFFSGGHHQGQGMSIVCPAIVSLGLDSFVYRLRVQLCESFWTVCGPAYLPSHGCQCSIHVVLHVHIPSLYHRRTSSIASPASVHRSFASPSPPPVQRTPENGSHPLPMGGCLVFVCSLVQFSCSLFCWPSYAVEYFKNGQQSRVAARYM